MARSMRRHDEIEVRSRRSAAEVFDVLDEHRNLAAHMGRGFGAMGGGRMSLTADEYQGRRVGSRLGMAGSAFGITLALEEVVTLREPPTRKSWETIGNPALVVIGGYAMGFAVAPAETGCTVRFFIDHDLPPRNRWLGILFGRPLARWCLRRMAEVVPDPIRLMPPVDAWIILAGMGILAVVMGLLFILVRPSFVLLPEDRRFTGLAPDDLRALSPPLFAWIGMVFRSWGGFALGLGILTASTAATAFRVGERWAWWALAAVGIVTIGTLAAANAAIASDFLPAIVVVGAAWAAALWRARAIR